MSDLACALDIGGKPIGTGQLAFKVEFRFVERQYRDRSAVWTNCPEGEGGREHEHRCIPVRFSLNPSISARGESTVYQLLVPSIHKLPAPRQVSAEPISDDGWAAKHGVAASADT
jgi:hypothetical protein